MEPSIEKKLTELFLSNAELLDEGQSPLLTRPRRAALEALNLLGIPPKGPGNGDRYHYTDLRGVFGEEWEHYFTPSHPGVAPDDLPGQMHRMKFLNGFCCDARHLTRLVWCSGRWPPLRANIPDWSENITIPSRTAVAVRWPN